MKKRSLIFTLNKCPARYGIFILVLASSLTILNSCSFEKRVYRTGYHLEWSNRKGAPSLSSIGLLSERKSNSANDTSVKGKPKTIGALTKSIVPNTRSLRLENDGVSSFSAEKNFINKSHALQRLEYCGNENNSLISKVTHSKEIASFSLPPKTTFKEIKNKYQTVALILCLFFGFLGVHRFYLGYKGVGVLYVLGCVFGVLSYLVLQYSGTLYFSAIGFCLLGATILGILFFWILDLIRISLNNLKPKQGDYS